MSQTLRRDLFSQPNGTGLHEPRRATSPCPSCKGPDQVIPAASSSCVHGASCDLDFKDRCLWGVEEAKATLSF